MRPIRLNLSNRKIISIVGLVITLFIGWFWDKNTGGEIKGAQDNQYTVSKVIDGDTFVVDNGKKVRMIGIDTPETKDPNRPDGCFGKQAEEFTRNLILGKEVYLEKDVSETDRYGRLLRYVYLNNEMVNLILIKEGMATVATFPPDVKYQELFLKHQSLARQENMGMWGNCPIVP